MFKPFFIVLLFFGSVTWAAQGAEVAIYTDNGVGTWPDGITAFEQFLNWKGISYQEITALDVNNVSLKDDYQVIYFPGGFAWYYKAAIDSAGIEHIRELVSSGGGYIGMCAGAYFASDSVEWEEDGKIDYPLDLFDGVAKGAIDAIAPWDDYTMTGLRMDTTNVINRYEPPEETMLYYGGPVFKPHSGVQVDTVATWSSYFDSLAIINFTYGAGRVLLIAPHPEIEEDSDRDSTTFAQELDDRGSDWPFLWSAMDWLLGRPITYPSVSALHSWPQKATVPDDIEIEGNYPNPFGLGSPFRQNQATTSIRFRVYRGSQMDLRIYNINGQEVYQTTPGFLQPGRYEWSWSGINNKGFPLPSGTYLLTIQNHRQRFVHKVMLIK